MAGCLSTKSSRFDDLTNDLLVDIFMWVPAKPLHRFKCVSKHWLSLISAPSFARSFMLTAQHHRHPADRLLLFEIFDYTGTVVLGEVHALPLLEDGSVKASALPFTFDFIPPPRQPNPDNTPTERTKTLLRRRSLFCSYNGLVLITGLFQDLYPVNSESCRYFHYYLCNPITKEWVELPSIPTCETVGFTCYCIQQTEGQGKISRIWADATFYENIDRHNASYDPNKIEFTVVSFTWDGKKKVFIAHVFSSIDEVPEWSIFHVPRPPGFCFVRLHDKKKAVFVNGKFHWCGENSIAVYDPFNQPLHCDIISFPPMDSLPTDAVTISTLEECEGRLRFVRSYLPDRFVVWDLSDYANKVWVKIFDVACDGNCAFGFQSFVGDADRDKVYITDDTIMMYDLKNKSLQHVYCPLNLDTDYELMFVQAVQPFMSSLWPTSLPLLQQNKQV